MNQCEDCDEWRYRYHKELERNTELLAECKEMKSEMQSVLGSLRLATSLLAETGHVISAKLGEQSE